jgi:hypothetical protein
MTNTSTLYSGSQGSNINPETAILNKFSWFYSVPPGKCRVARSLPSILFPIHYSPLILSFDASESY